MATLIQFWISDERLVFRQKLKDRLTKGYLFVAFFSLGSGFLFAQAATNIGLNKVGKDNLSQLLLKGPVSELTEDTFEVCHDGSVYPEPTYRRVYSFDTHGRLLKIIQYYLPELFSSETLTYNASGKLTGKVVKRYDPPSAIETTFVYNHQGNPAWCKEAYPSYAQVHMYRYDDQSRLLRHSYFTNEHLQAEERRKRKSFAGNEDLCSTGLPVCDMELVEEIIYEYDEQSQLSAERWYSYDYSGYPQDSMQWCGNIKLCKTIYYRYDAKGRKIEKKSSETGSTRLIKFDQFGNSVEEQVVHDRTKSLDFAVYNTYDATGNHTGSYYVKNGQNHVIVHIKYTYDNQGNYVTCTMHDAVGKINGRVIRRTIAYYE